MDLRLKIPCLTKIYFVVIQLQPHNKCKTAVIKYETATLMLPLILFYPLMFHRETRSYILGRGWYINGTKVFMIGK